MSLRAIITNSFGILFLLVAVSCQRASPVNTGEPMIVGETEFIPFPAFNSRPRPSAVRAREPSTTATSPLPAPSPPSCEGFITDTVTSITTILTFSTNRTLTVIRTSRRRLLVLQLALPAKRLHQLFRKQLLVLQQCLVLSVVVLGIHAIRLGIYVPDNLLHPEPYDRAATVQRLVPHAEHLLLRCERVRGRTGDRQGPDGSVGTSLSISANATISQSGYIMQISLQAPDGSSRSRIPRSATGNR